MAHPIKHAENSVRRYGGCVEDYTALHNWFDESKMLVSDFRHRALRHHSEGIILAERIFGQTIINSDGKTVYVRYVGQDHITEDLGQIPSFQDWIEGLPIKPWMYGQRIEKAQVL